MSNQSLKNAKIPKKKGSMREEDNDFSEYFFIY